MNQPSNEARIANLEKLTLNLGARIEEAASDTAEELKAIRQEIKQGYVDIGKALDSHAEGLMLEIRTRFDSADQRLTAIEGCLDTMATKENMAAMETRLIETMKQLLQQKTQQI